MLSLQERKIELYESFINSVDSREMMKRAYNVFGNPVFIFDPSYFMIVSAIDEQGNEVNKNGNRGDYQNADDNLFVKILSSIADEEIAIINEPNMPYPVMTKCIGKKDNLLGFISVAAKNREFTDDDKELINIASNIVKKQFSCSDYAYKVNHFLFLKIIDGTYSNKDAIFEALYSVGIKDHRYRLIVLQTSKPKELYLRAARAHQGEDIFMCKKHIIDVIDIDKYDKELTKKYFEDLSEFEDLRVSVGNVFDSLTELKVAYEQAIKILDIGSAIENTNRLYFYEDYVMTLMLQDMNKKDLESLIDTRVKSMADSDKQNGTTYVNELYVYFKANRNINKAAEMTFVHKNSIYYRLAKIQEKFNINLEDDRDSFVIESSLRTLELLDKMQ